MLTRRQLLQRGAVGGAGLMLPGAFARSAFAAPNTPLKSYQANLLNYIPPLPKAVIPSSGAVSLAVRQVPTFVSPGALPTTVWRYETAGASVGDFVFNNSLSWIGPILEVDTSSPGTGVNVSYDIDGAIGGTHLLAGSIDRAMLDPYVQHGANTPDTRFMTHLHGAFVDGRNDGNPYATDHAGEWRPAGLGNSLEAKLYPPQDRAGLIWYHQHSHGITHLNVYAGLAGGYLLRDQYDTGRIDNPLGLPANRDAAGNLIGVYEVPLVLQDRLFQTNAVRTALDLFYPPAPWIPEFFGDTMCVNGAVEPFMQVEPRLYRFRIINGCNARFINLDWKPSSVTGTQPPMYVIGSDGGFVPQPWATPTLVIAPGERYDIVVDFSGLQPGETVNLNNKSPLPKPIVNPAGPLPRIMQFQVVTTGVVPANLPTQPFNPTAGLPIANGAPGGLPNNPPTRWHTFEEVMGKAGPLGAVINGMSFEGRKINPAAMAGYPFYLPADNVPDSIVQGATEVVTDGDTEDWIFANTTADTHPLHMHLVQFATISRVPFDTAGYLLALQAARGPAGTGITTGNNTIDPRPFILPGAVPVGPSPAEQGWKDTVQMHPGEITRIRMKFDLKGQYPTTPPQRFVFHCHILEHESNSMMRPYEVA